jgi:hypothetical protein
VAHLGKILYDKKGKAKQTQPSYDNTTAGVNKPMEGETIVVGYVTRKGISLTNARKRPGEIKRKRLASKISNTYTNKVDKKAATPYKRIMGWLH